MPTFLDQFYGTKADMCGGLSRIEAAASIEYVLTGMFPKPDVIRYDSWQQLPNFGQCVSGEHLLEPRYIVVPKGANVVADAIPQRKGGVLFCVDSRRGEGSMIFHPGGRYGENVLVSGKGPVVFTLMEHMQEACKK